MKKILTKFISFALALIFVFSVSIIPVFAASSASSMYKAKHPIVLVHGVAGFGEYDKINGVISYWGYTSGRIDKFIEKYGNECYEASVGPFSSAWDRACELYAQLTGTVTDYGAYHSAVHGHDRYGRDYTEKGYGKLMKNEWNESNPINIVAHSFGGVTSRLLIQLLENGNKNEYNYAVKNGTLDSLSPLFKGGKKNWVYSLTNLAAPSNGSTVCEATPNTVNLVGTLMTTGAKALGVTKLKGVYDFQLEHFGIVAKNGESLESLYKRIIKSGFMDHNDNAFSDLALDKAIDMNKNLKLQDDIYYFSYYGDRTRKTKSGKYRTTFRMWAPFRVSGKAMCSYSGTTKGSYYIGYGKYKTKVSVTKTKATASTWKRSDGMVPVESGKYPFHYNKKGNRVNDAHISASVGVKATKKGVWYVMPVVDADHLTFCGGVFNERVSSVQKFYQGVLKNIVRCDG